MRVRGLSILLPWLLAAAAPGGASPSPRLRPDGTPEDPRFFPLAVWLQDPAMAGRYQEAGINLYVGLWEGPTDGQLAELARRGMPVVCEQNATALASPNASAVVGWMHGDEPDNAQARADGKGYGPPIPPARVVEGYRGIRARDPSRPVLLNLGQGAAWDGWIGRGSRSRHPEDYPQYLQACDIASFDIYPAAHESPEVRGNLWFVARGVERLRTWSEGRKTIWNCVECTRIQSGRRATPEQVKAEVWMSIIHGSRGIVYFVHEWKPRFNEHALLDDEEMLRAVSSVNGRIRDLAPVLNAPDAPDPARAASSNAAVPVAVRTKRLDGFLYVLAVAMRDGEAISEFEVPGLPAGTPVEVLGEDRSLRARAGGWRDAFGPWQVHLYRTPAGPPRGPRDGGGASVRPGA